ncbi:hypothetical protein [Thalassotalea marina]|uniref:Uncharacterized protein n=1 Tax=Thalassotalea marina TaxID=1673741 RepID=A0A919EK05_9GAMM|nr:hypothetical protein [Thalassotalea marina]GHF88558.1 hypothetical protein GCM10017161_15370 [Thalassotalea marina]
MTRLAKYITSKLQQELRPAKKDLVLAQQLKQYYQDRGEQTAKSVLSSPQGLAVSFLLGALTARYGRFGALRQLVLLKRLYLGMLV